jgi:ankyrin repeat protein
MNHLVKLLSVVCLIVLVAAAGLEAGEIHDAASVGNLDKVKALLEEDPTLIESKDNGGSTPLIRACHVIRECHGGCVAVANYLIEKGADVNATDKGKHTPLTRACNMHDLDLTLIQHLIDKGADVNWQGTNGNTPLHWAVYTGGLQLTKLLIDNGADVNAYDKYNGPVVSSSINGTILQIAINNGKEEVAVYLVGNGASINKKDYYGNTELHLAAFKGYADLTRCLIDHGAEINAVNNFNRTPLYYAAKHGYKSVADLLIAAGADENTIVEANYGKAPQLAETLREGEAYIWQMGGFVIKTKEHLLIFNSANTGESPEDGLANGHLNPNELKGQNIIEFITVPEWLWPYTKGFFDLSKQLPEVNYVIDPKPSKNNTMEIDIPSSRQAVPNENYSIDGMEVHTIAAMAGGIGCLVEVDGLNIYYGGLHICGNKASEIEKFRKEIDFLKPFGPVDMAILTVQNHSNDVGNDYEPYFYLIDEFSPKSIYLFGANIPEQYTECAEVLNVRNIPVKYPESRNAYGERYHYIRD